MCVNLHASVYKQLSFPLCMVSFSMIHHKCKSFYSAAETSQYSKKKIKKLNTGTGKCKFAGTLCGICRKINESFLILSNSEDLTFNSFSWQQKENPILTSITCQYGTIC